MKNNSALHILMSQYHIDSRVKNETSKIVELGMNVSVFCLNGTTCRGDEIREGVNIFRFGWSHNKFFLYISAYIMFMVRSLKNSYDCVHAHDLTALPIAFLIAKTKRVPLIYDSHELWSHALHNNLSKNFIKIASWIEKKLAKRADAIITVSQSIATYLEKHFEKEKVYVIRNVPSYTHAEDYNLFREEMSLPENIKIILYQGLISQGRGVSYLVDAAILLNERNDFRFILMGYGPQVDEIKLRIEKANLQSKIIVAPSVEQNQLLKYTSSADIGVHAINNSCLNHDYCLPNKLFEYVSGGIAMVVTQLTELTSFVDKHNIGLTFEDENAEDLATKLAFILDNPDELEIMKKNSKELRKELTWENESKILQSIYQDILL